LQARTAGFVLQVACRKSSYLQVKGSFMALLT
jgi:hypothetical protein